uniref:Peptidase S1 domain-containing protein n=1 Tax=Anopheles maculatus TaxID=74869 RepID=A0A182S7R2_9DIPT
MCSVLASSTDGETTNHDNSSASLSFPVFFRSRFNPRRLQKNERLISALDGTDVQPGMNGTQPMSSFAWSRKQSDDKHFPNGGNKTAEGVEHQSNSVDQPSTEPIPESVDHECGNLAPGVDGFPWIAVLEHAGPNVANVANKRTLSKGVLIDRQHVLTTVSSVHNSHPTWVVTSVRLGDTPTRRQFNITRTGILTQRTNGTQRFDIETVFLHEKKDIALIRLANGGVQQLTDTIRPICLPREDHRLENFKLTSHVCQRRLEPTGRVSSSRLQPLELITINSCNELMRPYGARLPVKSFCARETANDNCTGTLGGPAIASVRGKYHVLGLRSYIHTETMVDELDIPSIYVRVGGLRKWISAVIKTISN